MAAGDSEYLYGIFPPSVPNSIATIVSFGGGGFYIHEWRQNISTFRSIGV